MPPASPSRTGTHRGGSDDPAGRAGAGAAPRPGAASGGGAPEGDGRGASPVDALRRLLAGFVLDSAGRRAWWQLWVEVAAQGAPGTEPRGHQRARPGAPRPAGPD